MDSYSDGKEHESGAKRIKLDLSESSCGVLCSRDGFPSFSTSIEGQIDISEGIPTDCDSGYEASTLESIPTPSRHTSPRTELDVPDHLSSTSGSLNQTPTHTDNLDTSQDSRNASSDDDSASTVSHLSDLSGLSELSGQDWKPTAGSMIWIQKQMAGGADPRTLLSEFGVDQEQIPQYVDDLTLWKLIINMIAEPPRRNKLRHVNTLDDVVRLLKGARHVIVLTGAGVSVSCGIPDFRSRDGIYSRLAIDFPDLPDPQAMFDINYFSQDPRPFFKFARDIYPGKFHPSPCHRFIKLLEKHRKLLRNYTQNIDTLEKCANIERVIECHGSFATATCTKCGYKVTADAIRSTVLAQKIPVCEKCQPNSETSISTMDINELREAGYFKHLVSAGIMKPDIVFFGEGLPDSFHEAMTEDKNKCDLLLVIGSSLKVRPVALIPSSLPPDVPQILINREPLPHCHFDVELLGDCDVIINHLCQMLGSTWQEGVYKTERLKQAHQLLPLQNHSLLTQIPTEETETVCQPADVNNTEKPEETEPNCTPCDKTQETICNCIFSTKSSSLTLDKDLKAICTCSVDYEKQMSIINKQSETSVVCKERHMSVDSARDSGIGENSNFTDVDTVRYDESADEKETLLEAHSSVDEADNGIGFSGFKKSEETTNAELRGMWQPKVKRSLVERLPEGAFYLVPPSRHIFPGAEVYYDPDEKFRSPEDSGSESSDSESDNTDGSF